MRFTLLALVAIVLVNVDRILHAPSLGRLFFSSYDPALASPPPVPGPVLCRGHGHFVKLAFEGWLVLHADFLRAEPTAELAEAAIRQQLKFAGASLKHGLYSSGLKTLQPTYDEPKIVVTSIEREPYGLDLDLKLAKPTTMPYVQRALDRGATTAADAAYRITYEASFEAAACSHKPLERIDWKLPLPRDPYLAAWFGEGGGQLNTCTETPRPDLADAGLSWLHWHPIRYGIAMGHYFDCSELLRTGEHLVMVTPKVTREAAPARLARRDFTLASFEGPVRVATVIGWDAGLSMNLPHLRDIRKWVGTILFERRSMPESLNVDASLRMLDRVLHDLRAIAKIGEPRFEIGSHWAIIEVDGRLHRSGRELRARIFWGPTRDTSEITAMHWDFWAQELRTSHVVSLLSHFGERVQGAHPLRGPTSIDSGSPLEQFVFVQGVGSYAAISPGDLPSVASGGTRHVLYGSQVHLNYFSAAPLVIAIDETLAGRNRTRDWSEIVHPQSTFVIEHQAGR